MFASRSKGNHSHIQNLGLDESGNPGIFANSIVGMNAARRAAGAIVNMIRENKYGSKCFLFTGPSQCGKTALTVAINEELGSKIPFVSISAADIYSCEVKKSETLIENMRKAVLVRIKEVKNIYEGEMTSINNSSIDLRSLKGTKTLKLAPDIHQQLISQNVEVGDVIHIDSTSGIVKRMGRGELHFNDYDLEADKYVPTPKNEIHKKREFVHETTLHDLDMAHINPSAQDAISLVHQIVKYKKSEITAKLREEVDNIVKNYADTEIVYGILLIEDAHILDIDAFTYLSKALDSPNCPYIFLTSNITKNKMKETDTTTTFGIPNWFLQKCLVIPIHKNEEHEEILRRRLQAEKVDLDENGFTELSMLVSKIGLVGGINIIKMLKYRDKKLTREDVAFVASIFAFD